MDNSQNVTNTAPSAPPVQLSREQILAATSRCLYQEGYDATTIRKIASMLNCAVGSIYRYFRDKHELLSIVCQQGLEPVVAAIDSGEGLERSIQLYHGIVTQSPETYRLMFWLACQSPLDDEEAATATADGHARLPRVIRQIITAWARQSDQAAAQRCWSLVHGFVLMGRDADECVAAVGSLGGGTTAPPSPTGAPRREAPEIVITMTQPPVPRTMQTAGPASGASAVPNGPSAMAPHTAAGDGKPAGPTDDVCLL